MIVDAGFGGGKLIDFLQEHKLNPVAVALTHGHIDHIAAVTMLRQHYRDIKVYIHKLDAEMLTEARQNLSILSGEPFKAEPADVLVEEKTIIEEAGIKLEVLHTPGHTRGSVSFAVDDEFVIAGDTLFKLSVGRWDLPGGDYTTLLESIRKNFVPMPDTMKVYPGHGESTTIGYEKKNNPFMVNDM